MITPFQTASEADMRSRAAALRASGYACCACKRPKSNPLSVEVYHTGKGTATVLCYPCARKVLFVALLTRIVAHFRRTK